jgi:hypothetical protein
MLCGLSRVRHSILLPQKRLEKQFSTAFFDEIAVVATLAVATTAKKTNHKNSFEQNKILSYNPNS